MGSRIHVKLFLFSYLFCSLRFLFLQRMLRPSHLCGCDRRSAQDDPCADAHTGQARHSHAVLSEMDSR